MSFDYTGDPNKGWKSKVKLHDDNNKPTAASFAAIAMPIMDDLAYLQARGIQGIGFATSTPNSTGIVGPTGSAGNWQDFAATDGLTPKVELTGCLAGDVLLCFASGRFYHTAQALDHAMVRLGVVQDVDGENGSPVSGAVSGAQSKVWVSQSTSDELQSEPITMIGRVVVTQAGKCRVILQGKNSTGSSGSAQVGVDAGLGDGGGTASTFTLLVVRLRLYS